MIRVSLPCIMYPTQRKVKNMIFRFSKPRCLSVCVPAPTGASECSLCAAGSYSTAQGVLPFSPYSFSLALFRTFRVNLAYAHSHISLPPSLLPSPLSLSLSPSLFLYKGR